MPKKHPDQLNLVWSREIRKCSQQGFEPSVILGSNYVEFAVLIGERTLFQCVKECVKAADFIGGIAF